MKKVTQSNSKKLTLTVCMLVCMENFPYIKQISFEYFIPVIIHFWIGNHICHGEIVHLCFLYSITFIVVKNSVQESFNLLVC